MDHVVVDDPLIEVVAEFYCLLFIARVKASLVLVRFCWLIAEHLLVVDVYGGCSVVAVEYGVEWEVSASSNGWTYLRVVDDEIDGC